MILSGYRTISSALCLQMIESVKSVFSACLRLPVFFKLQLHLQVCMNKIPKLNTVAYKIFS